MILDVLKIKTHVKYIKEITIEIICTTFLVLMLLFLCDMLNAPYQTHKNIFASKAFLFLALYMLFLQRPRLLNWQSLIISLLYLPIAQAYRMRFVASHDLYNRDRVVVWIVWILLLIATDMYVYKKINSLNRFNNIALLIYVFMAISMFFYRGTSTMPIIFVIMFIFYLIPLSHSQWKRVLNQFSTAWLITFFIILHRSLEVNLEMTSIAGAGRWYGCFVNIGDFGLFMGCTFTAILYKLYKTRKSKKYKYIPFILCLFCLIPILWTILRISTITLYIGILFALGMSFVLIHKKHSIKEPLKRFAIIISILVVICFIGYGTLKYLSTVEYEAMTEIDENTSAISESINALIYRAHYMFDEPRTFADCGIFVPDSFINYVDLFTSGRLSIIKAYSELFNFTGNPSDGIQVGSYFALNAHNSYVQFIFEFGYIGGGFFILWLLYNTIASIKYHLNSKSVIYLFTSIWMAMSLGLFLGESANLYSPIIIMILLISHPLMINNPNTTYKKERVQ